jgi:hypothetical protein
MNKFILICLFACATTVVAQPTLHVIWDRSGAQDSSAYGYEILPLGDQNGDSIADWAVWAYGYGSDPSYLEFFHGGTPPSQTPYLTLQDDPNGQWWIWWADVIGDVNGDGKEDWYIERWFTTNSIVTHSIYFGGLSADTVPDLVLTTERNIFFLNRLGDFNGDGFDDMCLYNYRQDYCQVYYGGNPPDILPDWTRHSPTEYPQQAFYISVGDLNGDNYSDVVSSTYPLFTTHIFLGGAQPDTMPAYTWENLDHWPYGIARDLNGDHYDELEFSLREHAELHFGGPVLHSTADWTLNFPFSQCGPDEVVSAGDFNRDGYQDVILLAENCLDAQAGTLALYLGHPWIYQNPAFTLRSGGSGLAGIWTAAGLGDVNGDGIDDIAVGAYTDNYPSGTRGRVIIIAGDTDWVADAPERVVELPRELTVSIYPNPFNPTTTISFTLPKTGHVELDVYDVTGRKTGGLLSAPTGVVAAGEYHVEFDGIDLPSGIYFVRMETGGDSQTRKMVLLK